MTNAWLVDTRTVVNTTENESLKEIWLPADIQSRPWSKANLGGSLPSVGPRGMSTTGGDPSCVTTVHHPSPVTVPTTEGVAFSRRQSCSKAGRPSGFIRSTMFSWYSAIQTSAFLNYVAVLKINISKMKIMLRSWRNNYGVCHPFWTLGFDFSSDSVEASHEQSLA